MQFEVPKQAKMRKIFLILVVALFLTSVCIEPSEASPILEPTPSPPTKFITLAERESIIKAKAEGTLIHYQCESFWGEDEFSTILHDKHDFSSSIITKFVDDLSKYGKHAIDAGVEFNEEMKWTILRCDIHGAISKRDNSYYAVFSWLLEPLRLDFIDNDFEESERGLFWEGFVNGVPTTVTVELPTTDGSVYEAWAHPIGHCHAHAWWELP
jgi:hypothetical protein